MKAQSIELPKGIEAQSIRSPKYQSTQY